MDSRDLFQRIAERSGSSEDEVRAVVRELFPQAYAMALERGGCLVVPHFATFKCKPREGGGMSFRFRPRTPEELVRATQQRRRKLSGRDGSGSDPRFGGAERLMGEGYVPRPLAPVPAGGRNGGIAAREFNAAPRKKGFFARLFGLGD